MKKLTPFAVVLSLVGILAMPLVSRAQSVGTTDPATELQALLSEVHALQAQLALQSGGVVLGAQCYDFVAPMQMASHGSEVTMLQTVLAEDGLSVQISGLFNTQTENAVKQFQKQYAGSILAPSGLTTPSGYVGKATIAQLNALYGCHTIVAPSTTTNIPAVAQSTSTTGAVVASLNHALGTQTVSAGSAMIKVGSYSLTASSFESANVNRMSIIPDVNYFGNLRLMVNGVQFGTTQTVVAKGAVYIFSGSNLTVPAGSTINVDVYADILSNATGTATAATTFHGCAAIGTKRSDSIMCNSPVQGQGIIVASAAPSLSVTADPTEPVAGDLVMGSAVNTLSVLRFTAPTSSSESVKITDLTITDTVTSAISTTTKPTFSNLTAWNGPTLLGTASAVTVRSANQYAYAIHLANPVIIPQASSLSLTFKADVASYSSGAASDDSIHTLGVTQASDVTALGATSNKMAIVTVQSAEGNPQTVLRTVLTATGASLGATSGRMKNAADTLGTITVSANPAGSAGLNKITITFSGSGATSSLFASTGNVTLLDQNNNNVTFGENATETVSMIGANDYAVSWYFPGTSGFSVSAGSSYTFMLRVNSVVIPPIPNVAESLSANISQANDVSWTDGADSAAISGLSLPAGMIPVTINSVSYITGQ